MVDDHSGPDWREEWHTHRDAVEMVGRRGSGRLAVRHRTGQPKRHMVPHRDLDLYTMYPLLPIQHSWSYMYVP